MGESGSEQGVEIVITFDDNGTMIVHGISVLEELWEDYHFFRQLALETSPQDNLILYKRYVRAALLALFNYLEGVLNKWVAQLDPSINLRSAQRARKLGIIRDAARQKLKQNRADGSRRNPSVEWLEIGKTKELRNVISHLQPSDNQFVMFQELTSESLFHEADSVITWIETIKKVLGFETHPNMEKAVSNFVAELSGK
jgi:hypothetical protein